MDFSKFNITFPGQKVTIINRLVKQFRDEHNKHPAGIEYREARAELDAFLPVLADKKIVELKTYWDKFILNIAEESQNTATILMLNAYNKYISFSNYQRGQYDITIKRLLRDRDIAEAECEEDSFHNPTWNEFNSNGLISKDPNANPSTNIAYIKRLEKLNSLTREQKDKIAITKSWIKKSAYEDSFFDADINLDDYRINNINELPPDPLEDYTVDYLKVDPFNKLVISPNQIFTNTAIHMAEDIYVYKDFSTGHFTDFEHLHRTKIESDSGSATTFNYALTNDIDDVGYSVSNSDMVGLSWLGSLSGAFLALYQAQGGSFTADATIEISKNVDYFPKTSRSGTALSSIIYSDVDRTIEVDSLALTTATTPFRYYYPISTWNVGSSFRQQRLEVRDTDLQEDLGNIDIHKLGRGLGRGLRRGLG
jgi:hypothetical protein